MREHIEYESIVAMLEQADRAAKLGRIHKGSWQRSVCRGEAVVVRNFADWAACKRACTEVWQAGIAQVEAVAQKIEHGPVPLPLRRTRRTKFRQDDGDQVDVDRMRAGQEFWRTSEREFTTGPQNIVIATNTATVKDIGPHVLFWRGVTAVVLADILENAGYRVELLACRSTSHIMQVLQLKAFDQPLDIPNVINGLSGWFYRTVMFQASYLAKDEFARGTGKDNEPQHIWESTQELVDHAGECKLLTIDGIWSEVRAIDKITEIIKTFRSDPEPEIVEEIPVPDDTTKGNDANKATIGNPTPKPLPPMKRTKMPKWKPAKREKAVKYKPINRSED